MSAAILSTAPAPTVPAARVAQIKKTAQQFEAIFVRQMLSAARKSSFGETITSSKGADSFLDMQDARFADIASQKGAFGLARMIEKQLMHREAQGAVGSAPTSIAVRATSAPPRHPDESQHDGWTAPARSGAGA